MSPWWSRPTADDAPDEYEEELFLDEEDDEEDAEPAAAAPTAEAEQADDGDEGEDDEAASRRRRRRRRRPAGASQDEPAAEPAKSAAPAPAADADDDEEADEDGPSRRRRRRRTDRGAADEPQAAAKKKDEEKDREPARRRAIARDARLAHNSALFRQPLTTLDDHLARGLRVESLAEILDGFAAADDDDDALLAADDLAFGSPILRPASLRDFYAFERHVATMWQRRGAEVPEAWYRLPIFYFSNVSEIRGPGAPVWAPRGSVELDDELEIAALFDTPVRDLAAERGEEAIGGYMIFNDWSARDIQQWEYVPLGPFLAKNFASSISPWIVTMDALDPFKVDGPTQEPEVLDYLKENFSPVK